MIRIEIDEAGGWSSIDFARPVVEHRNGNAIYECPLGRFWGKDFPWHTIRLAQGLRREDQIEAIARRLVVALEVFRGTDRDMLVPVRIIERREAAAKIEVDIVAFSTRAKATGTCWIPCSLIVEDERGAEAPLWVLQSKYKVGDLRRPPRVPGRPPLDIENVREYLRSLAILDSGKYRADHVSQSTRCA